MSLMPDKDAVVQAEGLLVVAQKWTLPDPKRNPGWLIWFVPFAGDAQRRLLRQRRPSHASV
jgi:hypothetical protein